MEVKDRIEAAERELKLAKQELDGEPKSLGEFIDKVFYENEHSGFDVHHHKYKDWECYRTGYDEVILRTGSLSNSPLWNADTDGYVEGHKLRSILISNNMLYLYLKR